MSDEEDDIRRLKGDHAISRICLNDMKQEVVREIYSINKNKYILQGVYFTLGFISVIISIILTTFNTYKLDYVFYLSLVLTVLNTTLNFFKIESKINSLDFDGKQFYNILTNIKEMEIKGDTDEVLILDKITILRNNQQSYCFG